MQKLKLYIFIFFIIIQNQAFSQDIIITKEYISMPFQQFVDKIESIYNLRFFYNQNELSEFKLTSTKYKSLSEILNNTLRNSDLRYYIDKINKNVFIFSGKDLIVDLPDYMNNVQSLEDKPAYESDQGSTFNKYFIPQASDKLPVLIVGDPENKNSNKSIVINGTMKDGETMEPLIGATIYIEELEKGSTTDADGQFRIAIKPSQYRIKFKSLGMKDKDFNLYVYNSGQLEIVMDKELIPINEVAITSDRYHNVRGIQMGFERISSKTIKEIPIALGEKDIIKVAIMLPGVQSVGEGSSGFNVRGSSTDQNMFYINKVPVYNTSHVFGFFSSFSPDIVKDFSMYKSSIPVSYGGRLASIFDITTRQGNKKNFSARGGISPITGHFAMEGPIIKDHSSFVVSARSTYSDWILKKLEDPDLQNSNANFYDFTGNLNMELNKKNLIKAFGYYSHDEFTLASTNYYKYSNYGSSLNWQHRFTAKSSMDLSLVFGSYAFYYFDSTSTQEAYDHNFSISHYELSCNFSWLPVQEHEIDYGFSSILYDLNRGTVMPFGEKSERKMINLGEEKAIESSLYFSDEFKITPRFTLYGGLRYSFYAFLGPDNVYRYRPDAPLDENNILDTLTFNPGELVKPYYSPELRFTVNYLTGVNSSVKFSYNRINQYLFMLSNTIAISPTDQWKLCDYHIKPLYSDQFSFGFYKDIPKRSISLSSEVFYKKIGNIVEYKDGASFISEYPIETEVLQGKQTVYGLEMMIKKSIGKLTGWISYSYSRTSVKVDGGSYWNRINYGKSYPSNFDKPHALNIISNYKISRRVSVSANLVYNSGRPTTYPEAVYYRDGLEYVQFSDRNKYRIPDYFRTDFSLNLEGNLKKRKFMHSYWMLNIYNITGRRNAYSVYFKSEDGNQRAYKLSIFGTPIITVSWNFKLGNFLNN